MFCSGRVAIVTGAAGNGLGRSIALTLAREGAQVVVNFRTNQTAADDIVTKIHEMGGKAIAFSADVFKKEDCELLTRAAIQQFGRIDICIVGPGAGWHPQDLDQLKAADVLEDIQRETAPIFYLAELVLPGMYERHWGRFIGIASHPNKVSPAIAYNTAKAARTQALLQIVDSAWAHGVTVNVIAPGPVQPGPDLDTTQEFVLHGEAWQQRGNVSPQDIADGVAFLCSESGRFVSGCVMPYLWS